HDAMKPVIDAIIDLAEKAAKEPWDLPEPADHSALLAKVKQLAEADLRAGYKETLKQTRTARISVARDRVVKALVEEGAADQSVVLSLFKKLEKNIVRTDILDTGRRIDGRDLVTVRPIVAEVGVLPRSHGSSLFTRGETQALA